MNSGFSEGPDQRRKLIMLNLFAVTTIVTLVVLGFFAHLHGNAWRGYLDHLLAAVLAGLLIDAHWHKHYLPGAWIGISLMGAFFLYLFFTGGHDGTGHVWFFTFPLAASFLLGAYPGLGLTLFIFVPALVFMLGQSLWPAEWQIYSWEFRARFIPAFTVVAGFSFAYERLREKSLERLQGYTRELETANEALHHEIAERQAIQHKLELARQTAEASSQAKSDFLAMMSHELRTPLNHIMGFTQLLLDKNLGELNDIQAEYLQDVMTGSNKLLTLVNDILDMEQIDSGQLEIHRQSIAIGPIFEGALARVRRSADNKGVELGVDLDRLPTELMVDRRILKQILDHLLTNAVKFTPAGGCIDLSATLVQAGETPGTQLQVRVADSGIGIAPQDLERIFNLFEQADNSIARTHQGVGLGLALTQRLVHAYGGTIQAASAGLNQGSTFIVTLPIAPP